MTTRTDELRRSPAAAFSLRDAAAWLGALALGACLVAVLFLPNGWLQVGLAGAATAMFAFDRRLGPLPAAMLVMLAVPVGRGAEVGLPEIAGIPVRAHDLAAAIGLVAGSVLAVRQLRTVAWRVPADTTAVSIVVFLLVGLVALGIGLMTDNVLRDIVRDARWWVLYGAGLVALVIGIRRSAIERALIWGMTLYAALLTLGMLMPDFEGGLKIGAYAYDQRMRLHYGQAIFLVPAVALAAERTTRRPLPWLPLVALFASAAGLTLTRALMLAVVVAAMAAASWAVARRRRVRPRHVGAPAAVTAAAVLGIAAGLGTYAAGVSIWAQPDGSTSSRGPTGDERPVINTIDRVTGREGTNLDAQRGGRLASYAEAFVDTGRSPMVGHGLGELAKISWAWGGFRTSTVGAQPGVDNAYLTVGLKAGAVGVAAFAAMVLWPLRRFLAAPQGPLSTWFLPAWLVILGLTLIESFAVSGYTPFALSLLLVLPALGSVRRSAPR